MSTEIERDRLPASLLIETLASRGLHISCAESCTGGLLMAKLVSIPAASTVFDAGFVTYSPQMKSKLLGIDSAVISQSGIVSERTALEMARGAAKQTGADTGIGITGVAGPGGGTTETPVGTVCFGFYIKDKLAYASTVHFGDLGRNKVREQSADFAIGELLRLLD